MSPEPQQPSRPEDARSPAPGTASEAPEAPAPVPGAEPLGGESACLLDRVCPECGRLADAAPPTTCPRCGAPVGAPG